MIIETQGGFPENDTGFEDSVLTKVFAGAKGWSVTRDDGWSCWISNDSPVEPKVGMSMRCYTLNSSIRGIFLDGVKVHYHTEEEERRRLADEKDKKDLENWDKAERERPERDNRWSALPPQFTARRDRFMTGNPLFARGIRVVLL